MMKLSLDIRVLEVHLVALEPILLPRFAGSKLEGALGHALYDLSCVHRDLGSCEACPLRTLCPYGSLYYPVRPQHLPLKSLETPPRPLVFGVAYEKERQLEPRERFSFKILLVGKAGEHLPFVLSALERMGRAGLGLGRGKFELESVLGIHPYRREATLLLGSDGSLHTEAPVITAEDLPEVRGNALNLNFTSLVHLKAHLAPDPPFEVLIRALQRRVSTLEQLYGAGDSLGADYHALPNHAQQVRLLSGRLEHASQKRSGKGGPPVVFEGGVGRLIYGTLEGNFAPFSQLLRYGELLGVGKWAHFGAGRYRIDEESWLG
jgi:hypothetical protein